MTYLSIYLHKGIPWNTAIKPYNGDQYSAGSERFRKEGEGWGRWAWGWGGGANEFKIFRNRFCITLFVEIISIALSSLRLQNATSDWIMYLFYDWLRIKRYSKFSVANCSELHISAWDATKETVRILKWEKRWYFPNFWSDKCLKDIP